MVEAPGGPKAQIELRISCRKLKDLDVMSKSDPQAVVSLKNGMNSQF